MELKIALKVNNGKGIVGTLRIHDGSFSREKNSWERAPVNWRWGRERGIDVESVVNNERQRSWSVIFTEFVLSYYCTVARSQASLPCIPSMSSIQYFSFFWHTAWRVGGWFSWVHSVSASDIYDKSSDVSLLHGYWDLYTELLFNVINLNFEVYFSFPSVLNPPFSSQFLLSSSPSTINPSYYLISFREK